MAKALCVLLKTQPFLLLLLSFLMGCETSVGGLNAPDGASAAGSDAGDDAALCLDCPGNDAALFDAGTSSIDAEAVAEGAYYVATNGTDNPSCSANSPCATFEHAADLMGPGDTLYVRAGTYNEVLDPPSSGGGAGSMITYSSYPGESVTISDVTDPVRISGKSWIRIRGFHFTNIDDFGYIVSGSHNEIANCVFGPMRNYVSYQGFAIKDDSDYNWVHHCTFSKYGYFSDDDDFGDIVVIKGDSDSSSSFNLIEDNTMFHGGHEVIRIVSSENVVRRNYFHNEDWYSTSQDTYGGRNMEIADHRPSSSGGEQNLIEGNRFGRTGDPSDSEHSAGIQVASPRNVIRYNAFYGTFGPGVKLATWQSEDCNADGNHVYNNTFFHNGYTDSSGNWYNYATLFMETDELIEDSVVKNNIYWQNEGAIGHVSNQRSDASLAADNTVAHNMTANPSFMGATANPSLFNETNPDLRLNPASAAVDAGASLTVTADSGSNSTSVRVSDSRYFQDGFSGMVEADWIKIGLAAPVQIISINHATGTITLAESRTWSSGEGVFLYKNSSGEVVLVGAAPDFGAYEHVE